MKLLALFLAITSILHAEDLHITSDLMSRATTATMFGKLPKQYGAANVGICNQTPSLQIIPLVRIAQQVRSASGPTLLPRDAALAVIAAAQGSSVAARWIRGSYAAVQIAAIAAGWSSLSVTIKNVLTSTALAGSSAIGVVSQAIPTHIYLTFDHESFSDPLQLQAFGCVAGIVVVEYPDGVPGLKRIDFGMPLPR